MKLTKEQFDAVSEVVKSFRAWSYCECAKCLADFRNGYDFHSINESQSLENLIDQLRIRFVAQNQPDKNGVWELSRGDLVLVGIADLEKNEIQLPTGEAPYRISDLDDFEWKYLREKK